MPHIKKRSSKEIFAETLLALSETMPMDKITVRQIAEESGLSLASRSTGICARL